MVTITISWVLALKQIVYIVLKKGMLYVIVIDNECAL
jgi:hypothetical protein